MTAKPAFPLSGKKPRRRNRRRVLFHFILFTLLGVLMLAGGVYGRVRLSARERRGPAIGACTKE